MLGTVDLNNAVGSSSGSRTRVDDNIAGDGVILEVAGELAAYLPYVWGIFSAPKIFLEQLCIKAGWELDRWRTEPYPTIRTFQVYEFGESD